MKINVPIDLPEDWLDKIAESLFKRGDAVIVTRCKKCKYYFDGCCNHKQNNVVHRIPSFGERYAYIEAPKVDPEHFCGYGLEERE